MKNFKLILKSLISNNACIEGGRKKQWFFATIMFFLAMILAILPLFVQTMNNNGDDVFASYSYGADVATLKFNEYLNDSNIKLVVKSNSDGNYLDCEGATEVKYIHTRPVQTSEGVQEQQDYLFFYRKDFNTNTFYDDVGDQTTSFFYLTSNQFLIHIVFVVLLNIFHHYRWTYILYIYS